MHTNVPKNHYDEMMADVDRVDAKADAKEVRVNELFDELRNLLSDEPSNRPSEYIEMARFAKFLLESIAATGDEYMSECVVDGETLGEFLKWNISGDEGWKHKWLAVAEVLGPDHAQTLYHAAVFTTKVA